MAREFEVIASVVLVSWEWPWWAILFVIGFVVLFGWAALQD